MLGGPANELTRISRQRWSANNTLCIARYPLPARRDARQTILPVKILTHSYTLLPTILPVKRLAHSYILQATNYTNYKSFSANTYVSKCSLQLLTAPFKKNVWELRTYPIVSKTIVIPIHFLNLKRSKVYNIIAILDT